MILIYTFSIIAIILILVGIWFRSSKANKDEKIIQMTTVAIFCGFGGILAILINTYMSGSINNLFKISLPLTSLAIIFYIRKQIELKRFSKKP
jgi:hypothetical protein